MRIGDYNSLFTTNALNRTTSAIARSLQRLSTGLRVNSPQDDVATFSEGVRLDSSIRGYTQAVRNLNDATGLLDTASSGISTQIEIVQKIRELAVQASNGTLSAVDRANLNTQAQALYQEFTRITSTTQFNGIQLLDGSFGAQSLQVGAAAGDSYSIQLPSLQASATFQKTIGTGTFQTRTTTSGPANGYLPTLVDVNGDGTLDLVIDDVNTATISVALGKGNGTFQARTSFNLPGRSQRYKVSDVNGDGIPDIIAPNTTLNTVSVLLGNGDGTFKPATTSSVGGTPVTVVVGDFNNDGKMDIVSGDLSDGTLSLLLGNGDGTFRSRVTYFVGTGSGSGPEEFQVGDFNSDGNLDIISADFEGTISILLGNGNGTFKSPTNYSTASLSYAVAVGDFNHDGKMDAVVSNNSSNNLSILLGNGDGTFSFGTTLATGSSVEGVTVGDLNGDGIPDIVDADYSDKTVSIFYGNGDGSFKARTTMTAATNGVANIAIGDLNKDGALDFVTADATDLSSSIFLGNPQTVSAQSNINLTTQSAAQTLLPILDNALTSLKADQALLGGSQVRLNQSNAYSESMVQNLSDARSKARDVDIAAETSQLVRNQILQQAQVAVVGQANVDAQIVLGLLKNL